MLVPELVERYGAEVGDRTEPEHDDQDHDVGGDDDGGDDDGDDGDGDDGGDKQVSLRKMDWRSLVGGQ